MDRYRLALDAIVRIARLKGRVDAESARYRKSIERHKQYICENGEDLPDVQGWRWAYAKGVN
jgi:xylulose-5-phosphate/fructose-6-phosphate phosphoketolase